MSKRLFMIGVVGIVLLSGFVVSLAPRAVALHETPVMVGDTSVRAGTARSEAVRVPPADVIAVDATSELRDARIVSVRPPSELLALEGQMIEVWSLNCDSSSHMLFNHFRLRLPDGTLVEESVGSEVGPGEWLYTTYRPPAAATGVGPCELDVELTEPGEFFEYVHDSALGLTYPS